MFDLNLQKAAEEINSRDAKRVLIQLPDGLKNRTDEIVSYLEENTDAEIISWLGSCFGACDLPLGIDILKIDLIIQWGHNRYWKSKIWSEE